MGITKNSEVKRNTAYMQQYKIASFPKVCKTNTAIKVEYWEQRRKES